MNGTTNAAAAARGSVRRVALIGNYLPRRCGIATFTFDTYHALRTRFPDIDVDVWAMDDGDRGYGYPQEVVGSIRDNDLESYRAAARDVEAGGYDQIWLQHEFGIFGGDAGDFILTLLDRVTAPVAVTLHTVLRAPDPAQRRVMDTLVNRCNPLIVMAEEGKRILVETYGADPDAVTVIPHGIPDRPFVRSDPMKRRLGLAGRKVALTFGLLSPGKGIEAMIAALPAIVATEPDFLYVVAGETHPHVVAHSGESYRDALIAQAAALGVADRIRWIDRFMDTGTLLDHIEAADIYVTPYLNPAQITSGTLAYAVGLGKPVVSTPYVHAKELLADGLGRLVPFNDPAALARAITGLLADPATMESLRTRTYALGRTMIWPRLAERAVAAFARLPKAAPRLMRAIPMPARVPFVAIDRMTDDVGMFQHCVFAIPDRAHGYCTDDNARALLLMTKAWAHEGADRSVRARRYAAFLQHAWNPGRRAFRNFMGYDRRWLEEVGSEDSGARALWAIAATAAGGPDPALRRWAATLFDAAAPAVAERRSLRTRGFVMLAAAELWPSRVGDTLLERMLDAGGAALLHELEAARTDDWTWFEPVLAYDNARLSEALIRASVARGRADWLEAGLATLSWLNDRQTAPEGHFRAVGSDSFGRLYAAPLPYDQQPLEAAAMVDACEAATLATGDTQWRDRGMVAYRWFLGLNDQETALADPATGECFDGLIPTGVNLNQGAESVLAFYLATVTARRLSQMRDDEGVTRPIGAGRPMRHQARHASDPPVAA